MRNSRITCMARVSKPDGLSAGTVSCHAAAALEIIEKHGCIPHVTGRGQEAGELMRDPRKKARRWIVEVAHSCFNRFRKLLVRYEKLDRSFLALNHLAAAIMAFRKIKLDVNVYG